jgi:hypothetical protein
MNSNCEETFNCDEKTCPTKRKEKKKNPIEKGK